MPKLSLQEEKKRKELKKKAASLYRIGYSYRATGNIIGKSHQWVKNAIKELSPVKT